MSDLAVFHSGELALQRRLGIADEVAAMASRAIFPEMPQQHRDFYRQLPVLYLGLLDEAGYPWALPVLGEPGFVQTPDAKTLSIQALPPLYEALKLQIQAGSHIGALGLDMTNRRRNRVNGAIRAVDKKGLLIEVGQSFGNCPQYIQKREIDWQRSPVMTPLVRSRSVSIDSASRQLIESTDTFFIASRSGDLDEGDAVTGIDVSHRGGRPGFVSVGVDGVLSFPDFSGNQYFNTLGNIESDGRVGLFFPDFQQGGAVFVSGRATLDWSPERIGAFAGAQRIVDVLPEQCVRVGDVLPAGASLIETWPGLQDTGTWRDLKQNTAQHGYRAMRIAVRRRESDNITSFYLQATDGRPLECYRAGQYLPIRLTLPGHEEALQRCYTLSQAADGASYRISVKREEEGLVSKALHNGVWRKARLEVASPAGDFLLDDSDQPIVMLSAGVGITPMIAMLEALQQAVARGEPVRPVWFIHATQNNGTQAFAETLYFFDRSYDWFRLFLVHSQPEAEEQLGEDFHLSGRISVDRLSELLPFGAYQFYLCGPNGFMRDLYNGLRQSGIERSHIHYEFFGAGTLEDAAEEYTGPQQAAVQFARSDIASQWKNGDGTLLELAEKHGLQPDNHCRAGRCGSCAVKLLHGEVAYPNAPLLTPEQGKVLLCCAYPADEEGVVVDV